MLQKYLLHSFMKANSVQKDNNIVKTNIFLLFVRNIIQYFYPFFTDTCHK